MNNGRLNISAVQHYNLYDYVYDCTYTLYVCQSDYKMRFVTAHINVRCLQKGRTMLSNLGINLVRGVAISLQFLVLFYYLCSVTLSLLTIRVAIVSV